MSRARLAAALLLMSGALLVGLASAQVERRGGSEDAALAREYQQAVADRGQLQEDNARLKQGLDEARKQLEAARQQLAALKSSATTTQTELEHARASGQASARNVEETRAKLLQLVERFRETVATMRGIETERATLRQQLAQSKASFDQCALRNYQLYQLDTEVLDRYEHRGVLGYLSRAEPFTRLARTRLENLVDDYRQRAETLQVQSEGAAAAARGSAPPASASPAAPSADGK